TGLAGYLYVYHIWTGGNRMRLLRPVVQTVYLSAKKTDVPALSPDSTALLTERYRAYWQTANNEGLWVFPLPDYPFYREPLEFYCARPDAEPRPCADFTGSASPRNRDARPWNIVLILLETQRALNVGHLKPYGAQ